MVASNKPITVARAELAEIVARARFQGMRTVLSKNGKRMAAVVSIEDLETLERLEDESDLAEAKRVLADSKDKVMPFRRTT